MQESGYNRDIGIAENASIGRQILYEPLSEDGLEIRVLNLEKSLECDSEIRCRLRKFSLLKAKAKPPSFWNLEALSYTWGDDSALENIIINDQKIPVTVNLKSFLRCRRETSEDVMLWVDAVCINQEDALEKNCQIPLMNMIYFFASRLTIWLGPGSHDSCLAIELLIKLGAGSPYDKMPILGRNELMALQNLLNRPWWTRVWIVQELVMGGMFHKQESLTVRCGNDSVLWTNIVVAAVRMKAYHDDLRQVFPNIDNILELDSLRESAPHFLGSPANRSISLDLLCRYRHFLSSNPRDKLYAICNMFSTRPSELMAARYDTCVRNVFLDFAVDRILAEKDLEILRFCGPSTDDAPSWVPDWSIPLGSQPLPLRRVQRYFNVPWWANPIALESNQRVAHDGTLEQSRVQYSIGPYPKDSIDATPHQQLQLKRLQISAQGFGIVKDFEEIPPDFTFHKALGKFKKEIQEVIMQDNFTLYVADERCFTPESVHFSTEQPNALRQGEIITERQVKQWLLQELTDSPIVTPYQAAATTKADLEIDMRCAALGVKGILWETIEICHEGFVENLVVDWKNTTRFMVAIGCCKALALAHDLAIRRYPTLHERLEAFWLTLFAGQTAESDQYESEASWEQHCYTEWLPEIPPLWTAGGAPVTARTSGLVELAEFLEAAKQSRNPFTENDDENQSSRVEFESYSYADHDPEQWSEGDKEQHKADVEALALMWHQQPYDLYHRPFTFLYIVPDPYWETRKREDEIACQNTRRYRPAPISSVLTTSCTTSKETGAYLQDGLYKVTSAIHKTLIERPSMVPKGTSKPGIEQYALGRKFFITKEGRFGLGPKHTKSGDRVAIFFGSNVPFVLRRHSRETGQQGWQVIGETYVHGAMKGEVIGLWEQGLVEDVTILLR